MTSEKKAGGLIKKKNRKSRRPKEARGLTFGFVIFLIVLLALAGVFIVAMQQGAVSRDLSSRTIEQKIAAEKASQKSLRLELARLNSPARVARIAQDELGFSEPGAVIYLRYSRDANGEIACQSTVERSAGTPPPETAGEDGAVDEEPSGNLTRR